MTSPLALDLFCGAAGGWSLGLHRAGFRTVAACEIDPWRRAVFAHNFPDARMYDDVRSLSASRLVSELGRLPDIIVGSPPCQDASLANTKGKGVDGERTGLFFEAVRLVGECRPRWCAFENVPGLRTRGADRVLGALEAIGYAAEPFVVGADDIGAPHRRKRVWFVAYDPAQIGRETWWTWRSHSCDSRASDEAWRDDSDALQAISERRPSPRRRKRRAGEIAGVGDASNADSNALRDEPGRRGGQNGAGETIAANNDRVSESKQMGRTGLAWADDWSAWNGSLASHLSVDHGLPPKLVRECMSAFGDSVVPQIPEAIGKAIWRVEHALAIASGRDAA